VILRGAIHIPIEEYESSPRLPTVVSCLRSIPDNPSSFPGRRALSSTNDAIARPAPPTPALARRGALLSTRRRPQSTRVIATLALIAYSLRARRFELNLHVRKALHDTRLAPELAVVSECAEDEYKVDKAQDDLTRDPYARAKESCGERRVVMFGGRRAPSSKRWMRHLAARSAGRSPRRRSRRSRNARRRT